MQNGVDWWLMICFGFGNRFITALTYRIQAWLLNPGGTFGDIISLTGKGLSKGPSFIPDCSARMPY